MVLTAFDVVLDDNAIVASDRSQNDWSSDELMKESIESMKELNR